MSYYIEDDRKVIRTTQGFIFMTLGGDNNVTEHEWVGGKKGWAEVRARSWCHMNHQILNAPEAVILDFCNRVYDQSKPDTQVFKKGGKWVCCKDMPNYFRDGMRRAQTLEQLILANRGQTLDVSVRHWPDKDSCSSITEFSACLRTTEELEQWLEEAVPLRNKYLAEGKDCYICLSFCGKKPLRYGTPANVGQVVVKSTSRGRPAYVYEYITGRSISFTGDLNKALVFDSEEDARAALGYCWEKIKFVSLASQERAAKEAAKPKPYMLQFGAGKLGGSYVNKTAKNTVYSSWSADRAKRFTSEKEAISFAQSLRDRGCDEARYGKFTLVNAEDGRHTVLSNI